MSPLPPAAREWRSKTAANRLRQNVSRQQPQSAPTEDIGAVVTVIHRRLPVGPDPMTKSFEDAEQKGQTALINCKTTEDQTINLAGSCLSGANLADSQLPFADLRGTNLSRASISAEPDVRGFDQRGTK
jgi:hypothetical protein